MTIAKDHATLKINGETHRLQQGAYSDWVHVHFRAGLGVKIHGVCRFLLLSTQPEFGLYVTPINIDPENPAMVIGYPAVYSIYLAKRQGPFATLGLAEDTWGLSEEVLSDEQFLTQCLDIEAERKAMFFDGLDKVPQGLCACVFDGSDRLQQHNDQGSQGSHRRQTRKGWRPALSLGKSSCVSRRRQKGPDIIQPAQCGLDSRRLAGCRTCHGF